MPASAVRAIGVVLIFLGLVVGVAGEAPALMRVGGGAGLIAAEIVPMGRLVIDVLPLWFIALSLDIEYWLISSDNHRLLPFVTLSSPLIFHAMVGAAPIVTISPQGVALSEALALKGGIGVFIGPLGLFGEGLITISAPQGPPLEPFFALGLTLGF